MTVAAEEVLTNWCSTVVTTPYAPKSSRKDIRCFHSIVRSAEALKCSGTPEESFICLESEFGDLIKQPQVISYLSALPKAINEAISNNRQFNLWDWTLKFAGGDKKKALQWIAVLFQSRASEQKSSSKIRKLCGNSWDVYQKASRTLFEANAHYPELISAYPQADLRGNQGSLYHYYIPAYLASKFADEDGNGSLARKQAAQDATLFNMSYERGHLPMWNLDFSNPVTKKDAFQDSEGQHFVGSSYLGYRGSTWATDLSDSKSINEFKSELSVDPSNLVNTIGDRTN